MADSCTLTWTPRLSIISTLDGSGDNGSFSSNDIHPGSSGFPELDILISEATVGQEVDAIYSDVIEMTKSSTVTIDLDTDEDNFGRVLVIDKVKAVIIAISSPDGVKKVRLSRNSDADNLAIGGPTNTAYIDTFTHLVFIDPWNGFAGDKITLIEPGVGAVTVGYAIVAAQT